MTQRRPRQHDEKYLRFIRSLPCVVCKDDTTTEAAHIRFSDASIGKFNAGVGAKPDDKFALPLCGDHHRQQHLIGDERTWWRCVDMDPIEISKQLYAVSGNYEAGLRIVMRAGQYVNPMMAG